MCIKTKKIALKTIMWLSVAGMLFSGFLSYTELTNRVCLMGSCPAIATIPACVYGFVMYAVVFVISILGIKSKK